MYALKVVLWFFENSLKSAIASKLVTKIPIKKKFSELLGNVTFSSLKILIFMF